MKINRTIGLFLFLCLLGAASILRADEPWTPFTNAFTYSEDKLWEFKVRELVYDPDTGGTYMADVVYLGFWLTGFNKAWVEANGEPSDVYLIPEVVQYDPEDDANYVYKIRGIGKEAFKGNTTLKTVAIPERQYYDGGIVRYIYIGERAFSGCTSLEAINFPNGVLEIWTEAFSGCSSLQSIVLPESVEMLYPGAFSGCTSLSSIILPNSIDIIYENTFKGCTALTNIDFPESIQCVTACKRLK